MPVRPRFAGAAAAVLLTVVALLPLLGASSAAAQQNPSTQINQSQRRLAEIQRERARLRNELTQLRSRVSSTNSQLRNLEGQVASSANLLREVEFQISETTQQIEQTGQALAQTQAELEQRTAVLHRRLVQIYKRGPLRSQEVLLTANSFSDLLHRYKYLFLLARQDRILVEEIRGLRDQLAGKERTLQQSSEILASLKQERAREHSELARLEQQRRRTLASMQTRERQVRQQEQKLAQDERRLTALIANLERRRREAERAAAARREAERKRAAAAGRAAPAPAPARSATITAAARGSLTWPVSGRLIYRFGRVVQPNGTAIRMNGIGIAAAAGTAVRAIEAGTVVLASNFEGYGPTVVISHGGGYYSLYLHLREMPVREGASVTKGQVVGTVGGNGRSEGPHIEFQIRAPGGEAVDPLVWLRPLGR